MAYNVAVDAEATFTDVRVFDEETGELTEGKYGDVVPVGEILEYLEAVGVARAR